MINPETLQKAVRELFSHEPPKKELTTEFVRDSIAAYLLVDAAQISLPALISVLREIPGVVPRVMLRQKKNESVPEIRWVFVAVPGPGGSQVKPGGPPAMPAEATSTRKARKYKPERPIAQSLNLKAS